MSDSEMETTSRTSRVSTFLHKKAWLLIILLVVAVIAGIVAAVVVATQNNDEDHVCFAKVGPLCSTNPNLKCIPEGHFQQFDVSVANPAISLAPLPSEAQQFIATVDPTAQVVTGGFIGRSSNWTTSDINELFKLWVPPSNTNDLYIVQDFFDTNVLMIYGGSVTRLVTNYNQRKVDLLPQVTVYTLGQRNVLESIGYRKSLDCGATLPTTSTLSAQRAIAMGGSSFEEAYKKILE